MCELSFTINLPATEEIIDEILDKIYDEKFNFNNYLSKYNWGLLANSNNLIAEMFNYNYSKLQEWFEDPNTDCKILEIITYLDIWHIIHLTKFSFEKDHSKLSEKSFNQLCYKINFNDDEYSLTLTEEEENKLIEWYVPFASTGFLHWHCFYASNFNFFQKLPYEFDLTIHRYKLPVKKQEDLNSELSEELIDIIKTMIRKNDPKLKNFWYRDFKCFIKFHLDIEYMIHLKSYLTKLNQNDLISLWNNDVLNPIIDEIEDLINFDVEKMDLIIGNTKSIKSFEFLKRKYPQYEVYINREIIGFFRT